MNMHVQTGLVIRWEPWSSVKPDVGPLWLLHNEEIAAKEDREELAPDWAEFDRIADLDKDHWVTVRDNGQLVGYVFAIVTPHRHRCNTLSALWDLYWLKPEYRKKSFNRRPLGVAMLRTARDSLVARGVIKQYAGTKVWKDVGVLFERDGWVETERLYTFKVRAAGKV